MASNSEAVKEFLLRENEEFRRLAKKHRELDERLTTLSEKLFLTEEEKLEEGTLKKRKLALKDRMADLIRRYQVDDSAEPGRARAASA